MAAADSVSFVHVISMQCLAEQPQTLPTVPNQQPQRAPALLVVASSSGMNMRGRCLPKLWPLLCGEV